MGVVEEAFANVRADEARAASDEKIHGHKLAGRRRSRVPAVAIKAEAGPGKLQHKGGHGPTRWL